MRKALLCLLAAATAAPPAGAGSAQQVSRITPVVLAYRRACPAVVNISTEKVVTVRSGLLGPDIFDEIFPSPFRRQVPVQSLGSGFLVHPAGYVITNEHVVRRAQKVTVILADQTKLPAEVISSDSTHDLAVLKIDPPDKAELVYLPLGRSDDLMPGETVVAIGNPLGYSHTVSSGIISAVDRTVDFPSGITFEKLIQTDAPINSGSSGGPLLNIRGELIGINTAIRADAQNIGFAIPVDALIDLFPHLLDFERINRAVFGAKVRQRHTPEGDELYVAEVRAGTPADGRLLAGDRLVSLNGKPLRQIPDFTCAMLAAGVPAEARLAVRRGRDELVTAVPVALKPRPDGRLLGEQLLGMTLRQITPELARDARLPLDKGLVAVGIDAGSPADQVGLRLKDVIFQVESFYVTDLDALGILLEDVQAGASLKLGVARGNVAAWVRIQTRQRPATRPEATPGKRPRASGGAAPGKQSTESHEAPKPKEPV